MERENDDSMLRNLVLRLLSHVYEPIYSSEATDLVLERLPEGLPVEIPVEIPVLDDSYIVGSLARLDDGYPGYTVILGSNASPDDVLDGYDAKLESLGWSRPEPRMHRGMGGGFTQDIGARVLGYCWSEDGPQLQINAHGIADGSTEIRLALNSDPRFTSQCKPQPQHVDESARMRHLRQQQVIPELKPPRGSMHMVMDSGGNGENWHSNAALSTELDSQSVTEHYNGQLQAGGWLLTGSGQTGKVSFSTWDARGKQGAEVIGFLFVIEQSPEKEGEHSYVLSAQAFNPQGRRRGGGWDFKPMRR